MIDLRKDIQLQLHIWIFIHVKNIIHGKYQAYVFYEFVIMRILLFER